MISLPFRNTIGYDGNEYAIRSYDIFLHLKSNQSLWYEINIHMTQKIQQKINVIKDNKIIINDILTRNLLAEIIITSYHKLIGINLDINSIAYKTLINQLYSLTFYQTQIKLYKQWYHQLDDEIISGYLWYKILNF